MSGRCDAAAGQIRLQVTLEACDPGSAKMLMMNQQHTVTTTNLQGVVDIVEVLLHHRAVEGGVQDLGSVHVARDKHVDLRRWRVEDGVVNRHEPTIAVVVVGRGCVSRAARECVDVDR